MTESHEGSVAGEAGTGDPGEDLARRLARVGRDLERNATVSGSVPGDTLRAKRQAQHRLPDCRRGS
jgi:hypothetical protein